MNDNSKQNKIPRSRENDYSREMVEARRNFVAEQTGKELQHVGQFSFEPEVLPGNMKNFIGVAQVPIGLTRPLLVNANTPEASFSCRSPRLTDCAGRYYQRARRRKTRLRQSRRAVHRSPRVTLENIKAGLNHSLYSVLAAALEFEAVSQDACFHSADFIEGVTAFLRKRKPVFNQ